jgi:hypothetical protein
MTLPEGKRRLTRHEGGIAGASGAEAPRAPQAPAACPGPCTRGPEPALRPPLPGPRAGAGA